MLLTNGRNQIFRELCMLSVFMNNSNLMDRSIALAKVLCLGAHSLRITFTLLLVLWGLVYIVKALSFSVKVQFAVTMIPVMMQVCVVMLIGARAAFLLVNSQVHLMGLRKEIYINLLLLCVLFSVLAYDPKNPENYYFAKLLTFNYLSLGMLWMMMIFSLQLVPMLVLTVAGALSVYLIFVVGFNIAMSGLAVFVWVYVGYWLWRSPLQRQFKFESFAGLMDYCVERLKITSLKRSLTRVNNKEHVLLLGEGDGHLNRIFLAPIFSVIFTGSYVVAFSGWRELSLWLILLLSSGLKEKHNVIISAAKLWLLNAGDRAGQFTVTENLFFRLNAYQFLVAALLLIIWISINPNLLMHGVAALCLSFLSITATDYYTGLAVRTNKVLAVFLVLLNCGFMAAIAFMPLDVFWYSLMAIVLLFFCVVFRKRAQRNFLSANLSVRPS